MKKIVFFDRNLTIRIKKKNPGLCKNKCIGLKKYGNCHLFNVKLDLKIIEAKEQGTIHALYIRCNDCIEWFGGVE